MIAPHIQQSISELIYHAECVIVPGFGGFVANERPAKLNKNTHQILPPSREVSFNQRLIHNDGLLAQQVRFQLSCSYDVAMAILNAEVAAIKAELDKGKQIDLYQVGVLFLDRLGNLQFVPSNERNFLPSAFGLSAVDLTPIVRESMSVDTNTPIVTIGTETAPLVIQRSSLVRSLRNLAAAASIPMLIAGSWFVQNDVSKATFSFGNLKELGRIEKPSTYNPRFEEEGLGLSAISTVNPFQTWWESSDKTSVKWSFENEAADESGILISDNAAVIEEEIKATSNLQLYFVVGGAFKEKENAQSFVKELKGKGYDASIFTQSGELHLVAYGGYNTETAAKEALENVKSREKAGAWLKRMQ